MYKLIEYKEKNRKQWNQFAEENGTVFHRIEWKEILEKVFGYRGHYLMVMEEAGAIAALIPIMVGRDLLLKKAGISLPFVNYMDICCREETVYRFVVEQAHSLLNSLKLDYMELRLKDQTVEDDVVGVKDNNYTFIIPLEGDEERVLSLSTANNRNHVRKVYKNNWFSVSFAPENLREFYRVYCITMKRLGSPAPSYGFFSETLEKMPQNTRLLTVIDNENGRIAGGMFLFTSGDTIYYQWGGCLTEYNKKYINNFMYWEAVKFGLENGFKYLDLGRSPLDSGTYRFKQQWGAVPAQLKYYRFSKFPKNSKAVDKESLGIFISLWKKMPGLVTDTAGRILIKHVMP